MRTSFASAPGILSLYKLESGSAGGIRCSPWHNFARPMATKAAIVNTEHNIFIVDTKGSTDLNTNRQILNVFQHRHSYSMLLITEQQLATYLSVQVMDSEYE